MNGFGITSATMATGSLADVELYGKMRDRGLLTVRTRTAFGAVAVNHHLTPQFLADLEKGEATIMIPGSRPIWSNSFPTGLRTRRYTRPKS